MNARPMMLVAAVLVIGAIAVIGAGCGGDDSDSGSDAQADGVAVTTSSLSKAEFIKRASAACVREGKGLIEKAEAYMRSPSSRGVPEDRLLADVIKVVVLPRIEAQSTAIRELGAPAGDEEEVEAILTAQQEGIDEAKQLKRAKSTLVVEDHFGDMNKKLEDYGFTACVYG